MMSEQVPFINREKEFAFIDRLIGEWGKLCILFIEAPGGYGKTRLLQEFYKQQTVNKKDRLIVANIIDFDDRSFHVSENIMWKIGQVIDINIFNPYLRRLFDYRKMEKAGVSSESLSQAYKDNNRTFIECFNNASEKRRSVLLFDTTDALTESELLNNLLRICIQLKNCLVIMTGRNAKSIEESLQVEKRDSVYAIDLPPLEEDASEEYLQKKMELKRISIDTELSRKLLSLAEGRLIIIDLAVEWMAREIPLTWLIEFGLNEIETLSEIEKKKRQNEFECELVIHIAQMRSLIDELILLMSYVYPLDVKMIEKLLKIDENEAVNLIDEAQSYIFVKVLPDKRITLHDEMRRIVKKFVWAEADPNGVWRKMYSQLVSELFENQIKHIEEQIVNLEEKEKTASNKNDVEKELSAFTEREILEREKWILKLHNLFHTLVVDTAKGVKSFVDAFDEATKKNQYSFRSMLLVHIQQDAYSFTNEQEYELNKRRIIDFLDKTEFLEAKKITTDVLKSNISPEQRVDMLIQIGNIEIRLGDYGTGVDKFKEAVQICQHNEFEKQVELRSYLMRARNALGWGYRLIGNYDRAIEEYEAASELSIFLNDTFEEARILNNLAFAYAQNDKSVGALYLAEQADELWNELNNKEGFGTLYLVYSEIYRVLGNFSKAISYSKKALEIFEPLGNIDWLCKAYLLHGECYFRRADINIVNGNFGTVENDLQIAENNMRKIIESEGEYRIEALHFLGHIFNTRSRIHIIDEYIDKSQQYFEQAYKESKKASFNIIQLNCLGDLAFIAIKKGEYHKLKDIENEYNDYLSKWSERGYPKEYEGLLLKYLGDFYLSVTPYNTDKAVEYYLKGLPLIAVHGHRTLYALPFQLKDIEDRLNKSPELKGLKIELGKKLSDLWKKEPNFADLHPEARRFFTRWQKGDIKNG
ncbi:MAG: hypothetical protein GY795_32270 [Desulfobacterales bacterium]|nr:hypothetical protein [Desulfobacterales bacterium]